MNSGQSIEDAVDDIILRTLGELRKNAFGDDGEEAKSLPWKREQAWDVIRKLSKRAEVRTTLILITVKRDAGTRAEVFDVDLDSLLGDTVGISLQGRRCTAARDGEG